MDFVLGIESTAHTFGVGLVSVDGEILLDFSAMYIPPMGGIHPREAAEHHAKVAPRLIEKAFIYLKKNDGRVVAVGFSRGPGLGPCLRIGATVARSLSLLLGVPLYGVHHAIAHIEIAKKLSGARDPLVVLVSGGHTVVSSRRLNRYVVWGETLDISLGNLIDMFMRVAGFPSPAGKECEKLASMTNEFYELPYVVKGTDLSFSGILSALKKALHEGVPLEVLCNSLQETAFAMLSEVVERALAHSRKKELLVCGGVANNERLREMLNSVAEEHGARFFYTRKWNSDNGAMIAYLTLLYYKAKAIPLAVDKSYVLPLWRLDEIELPY